MKRYSSFTCIIIVVFFNLHLTNAQLPPRLAIPGAVLVSQGKPIPFRQAQRGFPQPESSPPLRLRRPNHQAPQIRPVVEDNEDLSGLNPTAFDDEVSKLQIQSLQAGPRQAAPQEDEPNPTRPAPIQFRPERPIPILRQDIRENLVPVPLQRPVQNLRHQENYPRPSVRQQEEEEEDYPTRAPQQIRTSQQQVRQQPSPKPQVYRQPTRVAPNPRPQYPEDEPGRTRKPTVQILRKYRTDNQDGSITWGYENDDGSFKEENLGIDCVTRGKYGYVDPDGVKREYSYATGNRCDLPLEEEDDLPSQGVKQQPQLQARNVQYRPAPLSQ